MILTLEVTGAQAQELGAASRKVFEGVGGTIGRLPDNDWVFPDPYISGRHALVRYMNGRYFIEDTSTNGVFLNSQDNRLQRSHSQPLKHGDVLYIDAYEIKVSIEGDPERQRDPLAALGLKAGAQPDATVAMRPQASVEDDRTASFASRTRAMGPLASADDSDDEAGYDESVDDEDDDSHDRRRDVHEESHDGDSHRTQWIALADMEKSPSGAGERPRPEPPRRNTPPPSRAKSSPVAPTPHRSPPPARPQSSAPSSTSRPANEPLQQLLEAAGIEGLPADARTAQMLGEILRINVGGLMEILRARERMKDELRMRGTTFKAANNNPLKFSANVDDAFHNLLVKQNAAYLEPLDAFEDAFRDVRDHQSAFLAAMRIAFESTLAQFDPVRLQEEFDRQLKKGSILGVPAKLRYWDLYRDKYAERLKDGEATFRHLFADEFARAYEEQLDRLKTPGRSRDQ